MKSASKETFDPATSGLLWTYLLHLFLIYCCTTFVILLSVSLKRYGRFFQQMLIAFFTIKILSQMTTYSTTLAFYTFVTISHGDVCRYPYILYTFVTISHGDVCGYPCILYTFVTISHGDVCGYPYILCKSLCFP